MLVVDRREDVSAYPLGTIRSEAQREPHEGHDETNLDKCDIGSIGVACVYETPKRAELLQMLLKRVWGCTQS